MIAVTAVLSFCLFLFLFCFEVEKALGPANTRVTFTIGLLIKALFKGLVAGVTFICVGTMFTAICVCAWNSVSASLRSAGVKMGGDGKEESDMEMLPREGHSI